MRFAEKLRELRKKAGLTQEQLAEASGLGLPTIRNYEQGQREPLLSTAFKLTEALGTDCRAFLGCFDDEEVGKPAALPDEAPPKRGRPPTKVKTEVAASVEQGKRPRGRPRKAT